MSQWEDFQGRPDKGTRRLSNKRVRLQEQEHVYEELMEDDEVVYVVVNEWHDDARLETQDINKFTSFEKAHHALSNLARSYSLPRLSVKTKKFEVPATKLDRSIAWETFHIEERKW